MYFDAFSLAAVLAELQPLCGSRVQGLIVPQEDALGFEIYSQQKRSYLFISIDPQESRMQFVSSKLRRGAERKKPLDLMLHKHLLGAQLADVSQPAYERCAALHFARGDERVSLILELMGKYSNIILLNEERMILDSLRRVGRDQNRLRQTLPGLLYQPPPAQKKYEPEDFTEYLLRRLLGESPDPLWKVLVSHIRGVSPLLAKEIAFRACGNSGARPEQLTPVMDAFSGLFDHLWSRRWEPCVAMDENGLVVAYAPYRLTQYPRLETCPSISEAMERYHAEAALGYQAAKDELAAAIDDARQKLDRRRRMLAEDAHSISEAENYRQWADALLSYSTLVPRRAETVTLEWENGPLTIPLDSRLSATENAARYYERFHKGQRAATAIPEQEALVEQDEAYLQQLDCDLELAENRPEIEAVRRALQQAGFLKEDKPHPKQSQPRLLTFTSAEGYLIRVGKNARQNEQLTFQQAAPNDTWLHARGIPGGHVIIHNQGREVSEETLRKAAELAAYYSSGRLEPAVDVMAAEKRYVRKPGQASPPGMALVRNERTLRVAPKPFDE